MRHTAVVVLVFLIAIAMQAGVEAREKQQEQPRFMQPVLDNSLPDVEGYSPQASLTTAAADTYWTVWYDFETSDWQGWTQYDKTAQQGVFFHVDDFAGLGGGTYGRLVPIEGSKSMWCGARGGDDWYTCSWGSAPGYGNNWDQTLLAHLHPTGLVGWAFDLVGDIEVTYDQLEIGYDDGFGRHVLDSFDGVVDTSLNYSIPLAGTCTKLFYHFMSDGAWSDEDGTIDTDGACIIDNVSVYDDGGLIDHEDFEMYDVGETNLVLWYALDGEGFGTYSGLSAGLHDLDPCRSNLSTVISFFHGSPYPSGTYPGLYDTPFCQGGGGLEEPCQNEIVISPPFDLGRYSSGRDNIQDAAVSPGALAGLNTTVVQFDRYVDLYLSNLVFMQWRVRNIEDGCPGAWHTDPIIYYYWDNKVWETYRYDITRFLTGDSIQVAVGVVDMCSVWYGTYGDCAEHTPAPWYDNVRVYRYEEESPDWWGRNLDLFQDTFPQDGGDMESYCRADMANDMAPGDEFDRIDPGDSAVVTVSAPFAGGLDTLGTGEARVYFHCDVIFLGTDGKPEINGAQLEGTYGSYQYTDMNGWDVLLCEPAATSAGNIAPDKYCIDLNDSLFTRGYMIEYYFKAYDLEGSSSTWPSSAESAGGDRYEFTCLPTLTVVPNRLFCDDFHNRGTFEGTVQTYYDPALKAVVPSDTPPPDRYDTNGPSSGVSNGIGAYVSASTASSIFSYAYEIVYHDSGNLNSVTITEGTENSDKSNDAQLLVDWLKVTNHKVGLLVMGDQVANDLSMSAAPVSTELVSTICGVTVENSSYFHLTGGVDGGGITNPLITAVSGGPFNGMEYYILGGCAVFNRFDVLEATGPGQYAFRYPDYNSTEYYAGIYTDQINDAGQPMRTVWIGHSLMQMKDSELGTLSRNQLLRNVDQFFESGGSADITDTEIPKVTSLSDNFPNPFNPSTRLKFGLARKGHVSIRIYDVSGRLVRILIDEIREAGSYETVWDGTNDGGRATASGIYFCRMEAPDYERTLKMVLLR